MHCACKANIIYVVDCCVFCRLACDNRKNICCMLKQISREPEPVLENLGASRKPKTLPRSAKPSFPTLVYGYERSPNGTRFVYPMGSLVNSVKLRYPFLLRWQVGLKLGTRIILLRTYSLTRLTSAASNEYIKKSKTTQLLGCIYRVRSSASPAPSPD